MESLWRYTNKYSVYLHNVHIQIIFLIDESEENDEEEERGPVFQETDFKLDEFIQRYDMNRVELYKVSEV